MIPDFQTLLAPILEIASDGKEYGNSDITEILARHFNLTDEELNQWVPRGQQKVFCE